MKPTSPLIRSKTLRTRLVNTAMTESRAEIMVAKIERKMSKMDEMRLEIEEVIDDMIVRVRFLLCIGVLMVWLRRRRKIGLEEGDD